MIPVLYPQDAITFETQGLGALTDCASAEVVEERNGSYELTLTYPQSGIHYGEIAAGTIITAIPSPYRTPQPFRVYKVTRPMGGLVTVYARHISYDLSGIPVSPFSADNVSGALAGLKSHEVVASNFAYETDKSTIAAFAVSVPTSARSTLGGVQGSILDVYGGEYEFDGWTVRLRNERGANNGVTIRYGKNLTACQLEQDSSGSAVGVLAYWRQEETGTLVSAPVVYAPGKSGAPILVLDCSQEYETAPTVAQLTQRAQSYIAANNLASLSISLTASFVHLEQMSGFEEIAALERCDLCDTVTIQYDSLGVDVTAKIVSISTDVLQGKYNSVTVGSIAASIASTIAGQQAQVNNAVSKDFLAQAVKVITELITGNSGGYVVLYDSDKDGYPDEILVMDSPDISAARSVWRWNKSGLGYSSTGYQGPYGTAITMNGQIVADYILAGTMQANRIKGGTLTLGGENNANGMLVVLDKDGNQIGMWANTGINISGGFVRTTGIYNYTGSQFDSEAVVSAGYVISRIAEVESEISPSGIGVNVKRDDTTWVRIGGISAAYDPGTGSPSKSYCNFSLFNEEQRQSMVFITGKTGDAHFAGTVTQGSDRRLKTDIRDVPDELIDAYLALAPRLFTLLASGKPSAGLIAQEVQGTPLEELLVVRREDTDLLMLDYTSLHALELAALQRMHTRLTALEGSDAS